MVVSPVRNKTAEALLDAAEVLLVEVGHAGVTTRAVAVRAGANPGLVHYYFGSVDELMLQVLERFTERLIERQRAMYRRDVPFIEKWRTAMGFIDEDLAAGYPKVWAELQALAWNRPELQRRVAHAHDAWREVLTEAFGQAAREYGLDDSQWPVEALVALVMTFNGGLLIERLLGIDAGHDRLLEVIDRWLAGLEEAKPR